MKTRDATETDVDALVEFNASMADETEGLALDRARLRAGVLAVFADPRRGRYRVVEDAGEVVGALLVTYEWSDWRNADWWWIQSVYVRPSHRRQGVFAQLYADVERAAQEAGACGLRLYVEQGNTRAQKTYERLGMHASHYAMYERPFDR